MLLHFLLNADFFVSNTNIATDKIRLNWVRLFLCAAFIQFKQWKQFGYFLPVSIMLLSSVKESWRNISRNKWLSQ